MTSATPGWRAKFLPSTHNRVSEYKPCGSQCRCKCLSENVLLTLPLLQSLLPFTLHMGKLRHVVLKCAKEEVRVNPFPVRSGSDSPEPPSEFPFQTVTHVSFSLSRGPVSSTDSSHPPQLLLTSIQDFPE